LKHKKTLVIQFFYLTEVQVMLIKRMLRKSYLAIWVGFLEKILDLSIMNVVLNYNAI